jgi:hypothetical protein
MKKQSDIKEEGRKKGKLPKRESGALFFKYSCIIILQKGQNLIR